MQSEPNAFTKQILLDTLSEVLSAKLKANHKFKQMMKNLNFNLNDLIRGPDLFLIQEQKQDDTWVVKNIKEKLDSMMAPKVDVVVTSHPKIQPTQEKLDTDDLEFCFNNQIYLTQNQKQFITDNFTSRKENAVTKFNAPITVKMRLYLDKCVVRIKREEKAALTYTMSVAD